MSRNKNPAADPSNERGTATSKRRGVTNERLRTERKKADQGVTRKRTQAEQEADTIVRIARGRADTILHKARDRAGRDDSMSRAAREKSGRQEKRADRHLAKERAHADAVLRRERQARKRYLRDFFAVERVATNKSLAKERAHADRVAASKEYFLEAISHDLRSLLSVFTLNFHLIESVVVKGGAGARIRKCIGVGRRVATQMNRLMNDLVDVLSIETGNMAVFRERVNVAKLVQDVAEGFAAVASEAGVELRVERSARPLYAMCDAGRIGQVVANLLSNAIKFTPAHGRVSVRVEGSDSEIVLTVTDTGVGIPESELASIFDRRHQVRNDRRGLGLGLYISKSLVTAHGGRIWVESSLGRGTSFHVALPVDSDLLGHSKTEAGG
jgi:signal transduction histidine kinase